MKLKIKKGSTVKVIAGSDKGKTGSVLEVYPKTMRIKVQGVRVQTNLDKKENQLVKTEGTIHYSNVQLVESTSKAKGKKKSSSKNA